METPTDEVRLRDVTEVDLPVFHEQQLDPLAQRMVAFTTGDPSDRDAFETRWARILGDEAVEKKTILVGGRVAGNVTSFVAPWSGKPEVGFWLGREFWGRGVATAALSEFLRDVRTRPLYARVAEDNVGSLRVLEKCGFTIVGEDEAYAGARGEVVRELVLELRAAPGAVTLDRMADLSDADREEIRLLSFAVYPPEQSADWPGRHVEWAAPEWCVRVRGEGGALDSFVGVHVREAEHAGLPVWIGGIGNVKTHPAARGRGLAASGIRRAIEFLREQPAVEFALLVCEPRLIAYYARLGWREFRCRLLIRQRGTECAFTFNRVMTHGVRSEAPAAGCIDLCGPPW